MIGIWRENTRLEQELLVVRMEKERLLGQLEESQRRVERLTQMVAELKREGFQPPAEPAEPHMPTSWMPSEVVAALADVAKPGTMLHNKEANHASTLLAMGKSADEVAEEVRRGGQYEPWA